eukprot:5312845-Pyramimonas_sp.AAC.1
MPLTGCRGASTAHRVAGARASPRGRPRAGHAGWASWPATLRRRGPRQAARAVKTHARRIATKTTDRTKDCNTNL